MITISAEKLRLNMLYESDFKAQELKIKKSYKKFKKMIYYHGSILVLEAFQ